MATIAFGGQVCGTLAEARAREWLVADGLGGYAMGTVAGLRTRRYHGLLVVATRPPGGRMLGLAALDPVLVLGDRIVRLGVHEWADGTVAPDGFVRLESFELEDGVPRWRYRVGEVVLERELAFAHGRPALVIVHRLVHAPGPVRLELEALCTWRDVHGERFGDGAPQLDVFGDGFAFESAYRVAGLPFRPEGEWYRGVRYSVEAERGLPDREDLFRAGRFVAELEPGEAVTLEAWAGDARPGADVVAAARARARRAAARAGAADDVEALLAHAADQLVVAGPTVVAGYPWFGDWSRDTMTSYEGLLLETGRAEEGRELLVRAAATLSEGMLPNTADSGAAEFNTADGTLWFLHAVARHVERTGDRGLASELLPALEGVVAHHLAGTRFGIRAGEDGLLAQGADGWALTWMDARIDGVPVTPRAGKAVEVEALWANGLASVAALQQATGRDAARMRALAERACSSFAARFPRGGGLLYDVVDPDSTDLRPNQLLAVSLPFAPLRDPAVVRACAPLLTSLGLRSLVPGADGYVGRHRGSPAERDRGYHQGTVWPWLAGPYVEGALRTGVDPSGALAGLERHLHEHGLGSISETADGDPPHGATGCPFQAWSVAEVLRARRLLRRVDVDGGGQLSG
jgi:predicted glycogen debranching enzyme